MGRGGEAVAALRGSPARRAMKSEAPERDEFRAPSSPSDLQVLPATRGERRDTPTPRPYLATARAITARPKAIPVTLSRLIRSR